ncbi:hypothetical protein ACFLU1_04260 [Chloroflexota bacterium]
MKLANFAEGSQALAMINKLHSVGIELESVYIADYSNDFNPYSNNNGQVTVWVGTAASSNAAAELLEGMVAGIADGNQGFSNLQKLTVFGYDFYQVDGIGSKHFFYQSRKSGEKVVWLTVHAANELSILEQAIDIF